MEGYYSINKPALKMNYPAASYGVSEKRRLPICYLSKIIVGV
jgi:hypothetical protein